MPFTPRPASAPPNRPAIAPAPTSGPLWRRWLTAALRHGAGLGRRTPGFWLVVLDGCMVGATLGRAAAAAVSNGAAVLRLSAVIALATMARLGFAASRAWCSAITWAALVPLSMACQRLFLQPDQDCALNPGTVAVVLLLMLIVTVATCLGCRADREHRPGAAG